MGRKTTVVQLEIDTVPAEDAVGDVTVILAGLQKAAKSVQMQLDKTFDGAAADADRLGKTLANALEKAVQGASRLTAGLAQGLAALLGMDPVTEQIDQAAEAERTLESAASSAQKAVKRSLAGFDQIEQLNVSGGGSVLKSDSGTVQVLPETVKDTLSPQLQAVVDRILALVEPVRNIDLSALMDSLGRLGTALGTLGSVIGEHLEWAWFHILVPLGTWVIEEAVPAAVDALTSAFDMLGKVLQPVLAGIQKLKPYLEPVAAFIGQVVILTLEKLQEQFQKVEQTLSEKGLKIQEIFTGLGQITAAVWKAIEPILLAMKQTWGNVLDYVGNRVSSVVGTVTDSFHGLVAFIAGTLTGDWERAWKGLQEIFTGQINGFIGALNAMISGVTAGLNGMIRGLNKLSFTLPDWDILGALAGERFGLELKTITAPQIPYLAQGAVLPANRPFLAVVGDQRHGTNVEAPLSTIQEAVALVMEDMIRSNLAGQEAIVGILRELLEAVLGIRIGDEVIGRAVQRYNRKMAVVKGGGL